MRILNRLRGLALVRHGELQEVLLYSVLFGLLPTWEAFPNVFDKFSDANLTASWLRWLEEQYETARTGENYAEREARLQILAPALLIYGRLDAADVLLDHPPRSYFRTEDRAGTIVRLPYMALSYTFRCQCRFAPAAGRLDD